MSMTGANSVAGERNWTPATRTMLIALAVLALLAAGFVIGRTMVGTTLHVPAISPAASTQTNSGGCHVGRPC
jgi:hypothetical protein